MKPDIFFLNLLVLLFFNGIPLVRDPLRPSNLVPIKKRAQIFIVALNSSKFTKFSMSIHF